MFFRLVFAHIIFVLEFANCVARQPQPLPIIAKGDRVILIGYRDTHNLAKMTNSPLSQFVFLPVDGYEPDVVNMLENATVFFWKPKGNGEEGYDLEAASIVSMLLSKVAARSNIAEISSGYSHFYSVAEEPVIGEWKPIKSMEDTALAGYKRWPTIGNDLSELRIYDREKLLYRGTFSVKPGALEQSFETAVSCHLKCEFEPSLEADEHVISGELSVVSRILSFRIGELRIARTDDDKFQIAKDSRDSILRISNLHGQTVSALPYYYRELPIPWP